jgi:hypothetical protein
MKNLILQQAIQLIARIILGAGVLDKTLAIVTEWSDKKISGAEKRQGVLDQLQVAGLKLSKSAANLAVELAVQLLNKAGT